ncbi:PRC and DUF2382 domain-containing protein [Capillimicrobium parvum]|uniref:Photosystem reaction center subunit H n=1 Tax=Capillimicrobium parvum TaxID=2884022 RepID=A0A9E7C0E3_9ACTN|nr:PRC and DUF2382 domain-containing protein [Capillimicrobium parvum]UGS35308.1 hypothetical protein DSM104329_01695 [Capillimicrobium parvum]
MTEVTATYNFTDRTLLDRDGEKIGKVDELYVDREGGRPEWALVHSGLFGMRKTFVPLRGASPDGEDVRLPIEKAQVKDAPHIDPDGQLSDAEERQLFEHYGVPYTDAGSTTAKGAPRTGRTGAGRDDDRRFERTGKDRGTVGRDTSGPNTDEAMTRSEEEMHVGKERVESGHARLRKYVVTEQVNQTVPVKREEVRIEREPITDANVDRATDGPAISEEQHDVVLHEERPVVEKKVVPKERVRLETDTVTEDRDVSGEVRKERIEGDVEGDAGKRGKRGTR